jgi:hypothetical protein
VAVAEAAVIFTRLDAPAAARTVVAERAGTTSTPRSP